VCVCVQNVQPVSFCLTQVASGGLSSYELERLENIRQNQVFLSSIKLFEVNGGRSYKCSFIVIWQTDLSPIKLNKKIKYIYLCQYSSREKRLCLQTSSHPYLVLVRWVPMMGSFNQCFLSWLILGTIIFRAGWYLLKLQISHDLLFQLYNKYIV